MLPVLGALLAVLLVGAGSAGVDGVPYRTPAEGACTPRGGVLCSRSDRLLASEACSGSGEAVALAAAGSTAAIGGAVLPVVGMIVSTGTMPPEPVFGAPLELFGHLSISPPPTMASAPARATSVCFERDCGAGAGVGVGVYRLKIGELIRPGVCDEPVPSMRSMAIARRVPRLICEDDSARS